MQCDFVNHDFRCIKEIGHDGNHFAYTSGNVNLTWLDNCWHMLDNGVQVPAAFRTMTDEEFMFKYHQSRKR